MKRLIVLVVILILFLWVWNLAGEKLPSLFQKANITVPQTHQDVKVITEESVVIDTVKKAGPFVITIVEQVPPSTSLNQFNFGPFSVFGPEDQAPNNEPRSIGSGFIASNDGLIVTNKHVVSDINAKYQAITSDDKKYDVQKIYRDPLNDVAILKIDVNQNKEKVLKPLEMGDSSGLEVGQFVIAIGTALGEFRNTVTTGVISGLGRGITAGDQFAGFAEKLDNVIQTDAAINPGNSGGPLLNSSGQVIGVNTAVSSQGQNIGFALPINIIKTSLTNFNQTGQFNRPYLGIEYRSLTKNVALLNGVPAGALVENVLPNSPAQKSGIKAGDIIVKIDGQSLSDTELAATIASKKIGDKLTISIFRDNQTLEIKATLEQAPNQ